MNDHLGNVVRHLVVQPAHHCFKVTHVIRLRLAETVTPAANLALHITGALTQLIKAGGLGIDIVQVHQLVDHIQAQLAGIRLTELKVLGEILAQDDAFQALHDVKIAAQNVVVVADGDNVRNIREFGLESPHHLGFPQHVVGRLGNMAKRRAAQHVRTIAIVHLVRQIGCATGILFDRRRAFQVRDGLLHEAVNGRNIQLFTFADINSLVDLGHTALPYFLILC